MKIISNFYVIAVIVIASILTASSPGVLSMYVPTFPRNLYKQDDAVHIIVNSLRSSHQLVPYNFYKLPYCQPKDGPKFVQESLGEILLGDNRMTSPYAVKFLRNVTCARVTPCADDNAAQVNQSVPTFSKFIEDDYRAHMSIDNLPGYNPGVMMFNGNCQYAVPTTYQALFRRGFAIGVPKRCMGDTLLNNHLHFNIKYHESEPDADENDRRFTIVGFTISPQSVKFEGDGSDCNDALKLPSQNQASLQGYPGALKLSDISSGASRAYWTYSVSWENSDIPWITRWDAYLSTSFADQNTLIHWNYIIVSMSIAVLLSGIVTVLVLRVLEIGCAKFITDDPKSEFSGGWKCVSSDVFRQPERLNFLAMVVGNGVQLVLTAAIIVVVGLFGFLSPANRGGLLTTAILVFVLMSFPAGYVCALVQNMFDVKERKTVVGCAFLFPGVLFSFWFVQNLLSWSMGASNAVPVTAVVGLFVLWLAISTPLTVLGASFAWQHEKITFPVEVGKMAREIPVQRWYYSTPFVLFGPGLIPFMIVFLELRFIFNSIWLGYVYYVFGFLAITVFLWMYTCALISITAVCYQLAYEDWRWWWRAFFVPSGCGVYVLLFCLYFYTSVLSIKSVAGAFVFWGYSLLFAGAYVLAAGAIGSVACLLFVRKIYGSIGIEEKEFV